MRHYCSSCSSEFFDEAASSSSPGGVFCVFCGVPLPPPREQQAGRVPFSADFPREEASALGVIGAPGSEFPDTLKQFRAYGARAKPQADSLSPIQTDTERAELLPERAPWRSRRFWSSLAVGFGVGAVVAAVVAGRDASPAPVSVVASAPPPAPVVLPVVSGCPVVQAPTTIASAAPSSSRKPQVTPVLERRFWLERARSAQRGFRLLDAERFYRRVLALARRDSEALAGVGELEMLRGAPLAAGARFREALDANADYVPALVALADLHWQTGDVETARQEYREIVERYASDLYPPYVGQRLQQDACVPACGEVKDVPR
jgi:tetratricopeptide (TPR) repeat protein